MDHFQVLIVGGGNAGISVAAQLLRKKSNLKIGIIEPSDKHYYQPAWTLVGAGQFNVQDTVRNQGACMPGGAQWIQKAVSTFQPEQKQVTCSDGTVMSYDALVVAPGLQIDWNLIKGLPETLGKNDVSSNYSFQYAPYTWEMIKKFKGGVAVFTNPSTPIKCGGAPHKIMYLACDYWRKQGILDKCEVHYVSGAGAIFGVPEYAATLMELVRKYNIKLHFNSNVSAIDGPNKKITFTTRQSKADLEKRLENVGAACYAITPASDNDEVQEVNLKFDFCHAVPPQSAMDFIKQSPLADPANPLGYIDVDKLTFRHSRYQDVFSCGDTTNAPTSKTGAAIRKQAPVMVDQILAYLEKKTSDKVYDGYTACPIPTQYGKLMLAEFDYSNKPKMSFPIDQTKPARSMWFLKKRILPWLYWNKILTGKA